MAVRSTFPPFHAHNYPAHTREYIYARAPARMWTPLDALQIPFIGFFIHFIDFIAENQLIRCIIVVLKVGNGKTFLQAIILKTGVYA